IQPPPPKPQGIEAILPPIAGPVVGIVAPQPVAKPAASSPPKKRDPFFDDDDTEYRLAPELPPANPPSPPSPAIAIAQPMHVGVSITPNGPPSARTRPVVSASPKRQTPRFLYAAFALAFVPLLFLTWQEEPNIEKRFDSTITAHPETKERIESLQAKAEKGEV